jgi:hypothetical protein
LGQNTDIFYFNAPRPANLDAFARKPKSEWLSKKRQMQGAQLSRNEEYLGTPQ